MSRLWDFKQRFVYSQVIGISKNIQECELEAPSHIVLDGVNLDVFFIVVFFQRVTYSPEN